MCKTTIIYTDSHFSEQLKKFRQYRGYKTQAVLCKKLNISRQVWSLWELNKRKPTIPQLIGISNFLEIDICYFFIAGAVPENYDLTLEKRIKVPALYSGNKLENNYFLMPFTETIVSRRLFRILDQMPSEKGYIYNFGFCGFGITRTLRNMARCLPIQSKFLLKNFSR